MDISKKSIEVLSKNPLWSEPLLAMRKRLLQENLTESIKWSRPVYSYNGDNIVSIQGFKHHFAAWFFNGVFLSDPHQILISAQEKTKAMRHIRYENSNEVDLDIFINYVREAIQNQKDGKTLKPTTTKSLKNIPPILQESLTDNELSIAFNQLTLGRKNEYISYIDDAKRESTKLKRMNKITPLILSGKGLHDQYK